MARQLINPTPRCCETGISADALRALCSRRRVPSPRGTRTVPRHRWPLCFMPFTLLGLNHAYLADGVAADPSGREPAALPSNGTIMRPIYGLVDKLRFAKDQPGAWHSQLEQDRLIFKLLRRKRDGFFVDLAANHIRRDRCPRTHCARIGRCNSYTVASQECRQRSGTAVLALSRSRFLLHRFAVILSVTPISPNSGCPQCGSGAPVRGDCARPRRPPGASSAHSRCPIYLETT